MDLNAFMYVTIAAATSSNATWPAWIPSSIHRLRTLELFAEKVIPRFAALVARELGGFTPPPRYAAD